MFSASIQVEERLLMKQDSKAMSIECLLQDLHGDKIMKDGLPCFFINGTELKLIIGHFVVLDLEGNADLQ